VACTTVAMGQPSTLWLGEKHHQSNVIMVKIIVPHIIMAVPLLAMISLLWLMPLLSIMCNMSHLLGCFISFLLELSQLKHLLPSLFHMLMYSFQVADLLV
jgi:hypothetical protein